MGSSADKKPADPERGKLPSDLDMTAFDARELKLWRQRTDPSPDQDRTDANLIAIVSSAGKVESVISRTDRTGVLPSDVEPGAAVESLWPGTTGGQVKRNIRKALQSRQAHSIQSTDDSGSGCCLEFLFVPQGRDRVMLIARDASATQAAIEELADLAYMDSDTGLPNRDWLAGELAAIIQRIRLRQGRGALICIDIEEEEDQDLKTTHGESVYRVILANVASRLTRTLRGANQQDEDDDERYSAVARIDETQFAVVLPDIETGGDAQAVAERLTGLLAAPMVIEAKEYELNISLGIALYPQDGERSAELLENGIVAVQEARFSHTSHHKFHSGTVRMRALERQDLVVELETALRGQEFQLNYLPIHSQPDGSVTAIEVLLRWPRPLFASRPIQEVIKAAEYTGLIVPIGEWVFATACEQLAAWRSEAHPDLRLAVNVSGQEFAREDFTDRLGRVLDDSGIDGGSVDLEITEHLLLRDAMRSFTTCRALTNLGINLVVDDFGTGICSFDYLADSPIAGVKIHQKFTAMVDHSPSSRAACAAITAMAHELGLRVTAEGVETWEQGEALTEIGCDNLQGFLFCEPVDADSMQRYLANPAPAGEGRNDD